MLQEKMLEVEFPRRFDSGFPRSQPLPDPLGSGRGTVGGLADASGYHGAASRPLPKSGREPRLRVWTLCCGAIDASGSAGWSW
jgi:hypothetical protein